MTHRLLPPADWPRLAQTGELAEQWRFLRPDRDRVIVVEDEQGAIVATWALYYVLHADGLWVAPEHRGKGAAVRHLLHGLRDCTDGAEEWRLWTGAAEPSIDRLLEHFGAAVIPMRHYAVPLPLTKGES